MQEYPYQSTTVSVAGYPDGAVANYIASSTNVPVVVLLPELLDHSNRHLQSLQMNGEVRAFRFRNDEFGVSWHPNGTMIERGYRHCFADQQHLIVAIESVFRQSNQQRDFIVNPKDELTAV